MRRLLLAVLLLAGCGEIKDALFPERVAKREAARRQQIEAEDRADRERRRRAELARKQAEEEARLEAEADQACLEVDTPEMNKICAAREREKDRRAQREQWERENAYREREAAVREHDLEIRQQALELERREARRQRIERAFQPQPAPAQTPSVSCTSIRTGDLVSTHCY